MRNEIAMKNTLPADFFRFSFVQSLSSDTDVY